MATDRRRRGFTLIELLVVIAIIAILAAILFPVFTQARQRALETQCLSSAKQIGTAVRMYVDDHNGAWPPLTGFNENPPAGRPGHIGPEETLAPYAKSKHLFRCPADVGGPFSAPLSYWEKYGQSFSLSSNCFSWLPGLSIVNDQDVTDPGGWFRFPVRVVRDSMFEYPSQTRIIREIMLPWFGREDDLYGQKQFFRRWHARGGTIVFADGHARFLTNEQDYLETYYSPDGRKTRDNPAGSW